MVLKKHPSSNVNIDGFPTNKIVYLNIYHHYCIPPFLWIKTLLLLIYGTIYFLGQIILGNKYFWDKIFQRQKLKVKESSSVIYLYIIQFVYSNTYDLWSFLPSQITSLPAGCFWGILHLNIFFNVLIQAFILTNVNTDFRSLFLSLSLSVYAHCF